MIIVHETFVAKPGMASKLAALFKEGLGQEKNFQIMTDVTGQFNRVVIASWHEDLAAMEKARQEGMKNTPPEIAEKMKSYTEMYLTGGREIFKVI